MRSVFIYTQTAMRTLIVEYLDGRFKRNGDHEWIDGKTTWVRIYDSDSDIDPEQKALISAALESENYIWVMADISGRIDSTKEATDICVSLLNLVGGVAQDDYSSHLWTVTELRQKAHAQGHPFFDTNGWYEETRKSKTSSELGAQD